MRCWAEVDLKHLRENINEIEKIVDKKHIMAVVKANAYGHGMKEIFENLVEYGIIWFGVATFDEAIILRNINKEANILVFGPIETSNMKIASDLNIRFPLTSMDEIHYLNENKINCTIHLKVDTGMGRIGFQLNEINEAIRIIKSQNNINIEGIFSHLSSSESDEKYTIEQITKFRNTVKNYEEIKYKHVLNSFGSVFYKEFAYDFIRPGIILYGGVNENETTPYKFKHVMSLYARISYIKEMNEDGFISYNNRYEAKKGDKIATVSIGYADGVRRELTNKGYVYYKNIKCPIIGTICMDQLMILIPKNIESNVNDIVEIFGNNISVVDVANICGTISYEILCGISQRVPRMYKN